MKSTTIRKSPLLRTALLLLVLGAAANTASAAPVGSPDSSTRRIEPWDSTWDTSNETRDLSSSNTPATTSDDSSFSNTDATNDSADDNTISPAMGMDQSASRRRPWGWGPPPMKQRRDTHMTARDLDISAAVDIALGSSTSSQDSQSADAQAAQDDSEVQGRRRMGGNGPGRRRRSLYHRRTKRTLPRTSSSSWLPQLAKRDTWNPVDSTFSAGIWVGVVVLVVLIGAGVFSLVWATRRKRRQRQYSRARQAAYEEEDMRVWGFGNDPDAGPHDGGLGGGHTSGRGAGRDRVKGVDDVDEDDGFEKLKAGGR